MRENIETLKKKSVHFFQTSRLSHEIFRTISRRRFLCVFMLYDFKERREIKLKWLTLPKMTCGWMRNNRFRVHSYQLLSCWEVFWAFELGIRPISFAIHCFRTFLILWNHSFETETKNWDTMEQRRHKLLGVFNRLLQQIS